ncbi:hypothetical protein SAY87_016187 [Trapa incisa]|uniref:Uncharacterized protein n=1 Tax=Trapa incisa TaxID=236973 RepID=A0AAN7LGK2_9MYRT|nr:hypothetical protein SAY87_016187 [Trapa incisa]
MFFSTFSETNRLKIKVRFFTLASYKLVSSLLVGMELKTRDPDIHFRDENSSTNTPELCRYRVYSWINEKGSRPARFGSKKRRHVKKYVQPPFPALYIKDHLASPFFTTTKHPQRQPPIIYNTRPKEEE